MTRPRPSAAAPRASERFLLRLPPGLHAALRRAAARGGLSLNDYCVRRLAGPGAGAATHAGARETVRRAAELLGDGLVGVVAFGSWARGQASARSDVDVLVVTAHEVALTRDPYRAWDRVPVTWEGRAVEPHFAHLPRPGEHVTGTWAEVTLDGLVLYEQAWEVSRHLVRVRRDIAEGRLVRRVVHGQPYWTAVA